MKASVGSLVAGLAVVLLEGFATAVSAQLWESIGPYGGTITALAVSPTSIYAGGYDGGVFKTPLVTGGEGSWEATMGPPYPPSGVRAIGVDQSQPATVYAAFHGAGFWASTDGGTSWRDTRPRTGDVTHHWLLALALHPGDTGRVYVGSLVGGVIETRDGGETWEARPLPEGNPAVWALTFDPTSTSILYAGTVGGGVFKSEDGGLNWTAVNQALTSAPVNALAFDARGRSLYAGTDHGLYRSTDGGATWLERTPGQPFRSRVQALANVGGIDVMLAGTDLGIFWSDDGAESWHASSLGIPANPRTRTYSLAVNPYALPGVVYAGTELGFLTSRDAGQTWVPSENAGLSNVSVEALAIAESNLYAGTPDGIHKSANGGRSWVRANEGLADYGRDFVYEIAIDPVNEARVYASTDTGFYESTDAAETWTRMSAEEMETFVIDPDGSQMFGGRSSFVTAGDPGVFMSSDSGATWTPRNDGLTVREVTDLAMDPQEPKVLLVTTRGGGVFKSNDAGASWVPVNAGLPKLDAQSVAVDPDDSALVLVALHNDGVWRSLDGGMTWFPTSLTANVYDIRFDRRYLRGIYAAGVCDGVFESTDDGVTWVEINADLGNRCVYQLMAHPTRALLYAATGGSSVFRFDRESPTTTTTSTSTPSTTSTSTTVPRSIGVRGRRLIVVDPGAGVGTPKVIFLAKDRAVTKGAGTDRADIGVEFTVRYADGRASGGFSLPRGDGSWRANGSRVARFVNEDAPQGATQAANAVIKRGKFLKLFGKGLGDVPFDVGSAGRPDMGVYTAYCVLNGDEPLCHCSVFTTCAYKSIAKGRGVKLACKRGGEKDPGCSAARSDEEGLRSFQRADTRCDDHAEGCTRSVEGK